MIIYNYIYLREFSHKSYLLLSFIVLIPVYKTCLLFNESDRYRFYNKTVHMTLVCAVCGYVDLLLAGPLVIDIIFMIQERREGVSGAPPLSVREATPGYA